MSYAYDPLGRRVSKSLGNAGTLAATYLNAGDDEIATYDGSGTLVRRYVPGPGVDQPIASVAADGTKTYFHQDKLGSVIAMTNAAGAVAAGPYAYDEYGNCLSSGGCPSDTQPYGFTGRRFDAETGLYYYRARYYSPSLGRFLQTDPIGYQDDIDWYAYVANDPTDRTDPTGMVGGSDHYEDVLAGRAQPVATPEQASSGMRKVLDFVGMVSESLGGALMAMPVTAPVGRVLTEEGVALREATALTKAEQITANAAQGRAGEAITAAKLGDSVAGTQVSIRTSGGSLTRADFVTKAGGVVETKTGGAGLSINQEKLRSDIAAGLAVTPVGKNAANAGFVPGTPVVLKAYNIDHPF